MFVKFVLETEGSDISNRKGSPCEAVAPYREYLIEAVVIEYMKLRYENQDLGRCRVLGADPRDGEEYIDLLLPQTSDRLIATHCSMFVMNNEGRTIDSLVCP